MVVGLVLRDPQDLAAGSGIDAGRIAGDDLRFRQDVVELRRERAPEHPRAARAAVDHPDLAAAVVGEQAAAPVARMVEEVQERIGALVAGPRRRAELDQFQRGKAALLDARGDRVGDGGPRPARHGCAERRDCEPAQSRQRRFQHRARAEQGFAVRTELFVLHACAPRPCWRPSSAPACLACRRRSPRSRYPSFAARPCGPCRSDGSR
jgi:hypothetical protein